MRHDVASKVEEEEKKDDAMDTNAVMSSIETRPASHGVSPLCERRRKQRYTDADVQSDCQVHVHATNNHALQSASSFILPPVIPCDIVVHLIASFVNDPRTLYSMASVCRSWRNAFQNDLLSSPSLWHRLYSHRWTRSSTSYMYNSDSLSDWKRKYRQRHEREQIVAQFLKDAVGNDNQVSYRQAENLQFGQSLHGGLLESIDFLELKCDRWRRMVFGRGRPRYWVMDFLCAMANHEVDYLSLLDQEDDNHGGYITSLTNLERFLAASTVFSLHCHELFHHFDEILEQEKQHQHKLSQVLSYPHLLSSLSSPPTFEDAAILVAHALRPAFELLQRSSSLQQLRFDVLQRLDQIAQLVRHFIQYACRTSTRSCEKSGFSCPCHDPRVVLFTIHYVLTKQYGISCFKRMQDMVSPYSHTQSESSLRNSCSILNVLTNRKLHRQSAEAQEQLRFSENQASDQSCARAKSNTFRCHPLLLTIVFQAIARRLGLKCDVVVGCHEIFHTLVRVSFSPNTSSSQPELPQTSDPHCQLLFVDLSNGSVKILTLAQIQDQTKSPTTADSGGCSNLISRVHDTVARENHVTIIPDDTEEESSSVASNQSRKDRFGGLPLLEVTTLMKWLAKPILEEHFQSGDVAELQPYHILLEHLAHGHGSHLLTELQKRLVLFPSMLRHCNLVPPSA